MKPLFWLEIYSRETRSSGLDGVDMTGEICVQLDVKLRSIVCQGMLMSFFKSLKAFGSSMLPRILLVYALFLPCI